MRASFSRSPDFRGMGRAVERDIRKSLALRVEVALTQFQMFILETPVYTGRTLANFRWSLGEPVTTVRAPVKTPERPGKTSEMSLGEEPRRAANAALVESEFSSLIRSYAANPFQKIFLTNNVPNYDEIEYGTYGASARTPAGGMTRRGEAAIKLIIRGVTKA